MSSNTIFDLNIKNILSDWSVSDALRELIANAIDESKLSRTQFPDIQYNENTNQLLIRDYGRGIHSNHFIQNENDEKKNSKVVIGKFGIGLKDAVSVLFRNNKPVTFVSLHGSFVPVEDYKKGVQEETKTIHISQTFDNKIDIGTKVIIEAISPTDYNDAIANFLELFPYNKLSESPKGQIYEKRQTSEIFFNGMKISTDNNFLFSYNILEANASLRKSLNRERKMVSRDAYRDNVISILKSNITSQSQDLINQLLNNRDAYEHGEWSLIDIKKLVLKNTDRKILVGCHEQMDSPAYVDYAENQAYEIIWLNPTEYKNIKNDSNYEKYTLDSFGRNFVNNYESLEIGINQLVSADQDNWHWVLSKVKELANIWPEWKKDYNNFKFSIIEDHPNANGITQNGKIEIVQRIIPNKQHLFNTVIHEICHAISGAVDSTVEFENVLTSAYYYVLQLSSF